MILENSPLGKKSSYTALYMPSLLFSIPRHLNRSEIGISASLPFDGVDIWNAYELSWLNAKGKPEIALAEFLIPCTSPCIIESKSLKLYLNSFNQTRLTQGIAELLMLLEKDLSEAAQAKVTVKLCSPAAFDQVKIKELTGKYLDDLDIDTDTYTITPDFLQTSREESEEVLYSHLLKSNCPITSQPDWGSIWIQYAGPKISHEGLLKYIISFRNHNEFHEQCIERIFVDIMERCRPHKLAVYGRYTRRGGLDINAFRSNFSFNPDNWRNHRQ